MALTIALAAHACGKRGEPQPPYPRTPQGATELRVAQRGEELEVSYVAPATTTSGFPLPVLEVELVRADVAGPLDKVARRRWRRVAPGERLVEKTPLPVPGTLIRTAARARSRGALSALTPVITFTVEVPPPKPTNLVAQLRPEGVALAWTSPFPKPTPTPAPTPTPTPTATPMPTPKPTPPATPSAGARGPSASPRPSPTPTPTPTPTPRPPPAFWVYRRARTGGSYGGPLNGTPITTTALSDTAARRGENWCYVVRGVVATTPVAVESEPSEEVCMAVQDVFAPAPPSGVAVLWREGAAEVSWSPSAEPDLAGYRVYRTTGEAAPRRLADPPPTETSFLERGLPGGVHAYTVTAVDRDGNESKASRPAEVRVP
jgi:hypothetical protein